MQIFLAFILVVTAFLIPTDDGVVTLQSLEWKSYISIYLGITMLWLFRTWWALGIALIEFFLIFVNATVSYYWDTVSVFDKHYPDIQALAFICELLIILGVVMRDYVYHRLVSIFAGLFYRSRIK